MSDDWVDVSRAELIERNKTLMAAVTSGTATRADKANLEATMDVIEKRTAEKNALDTMTRQDLMKKNAALMAKVKGGTATRADAERLTDTMAAMEAEDKERTNAKRESAVMDTKALVKRSEKLVAALTSGTATRADKAKLEATMDAIEKAKADAVAIRTSMSIVDLIKRNEALMAKMKEGTATRAEMEKVSRVTDELGRRTMTKSKIEAETDTRALIKRNEALMESMKEGTATRADREELEALMRRKEELDRELKATTAFETAAKLTKARAEVRLTERQTDVRNLMKKVKSSERTDLCFMTDATGSMGAHIEAVKTQIVKIATDVQKTNPQLKLRVAITGYRDALEGDGGNSAFDFTDNLDSFVSNVSSICAQGGGDGCEDVESGFSDALSFSWDSPTRVVIWIADAPSHGTRYHGGLANDHHPDSGRGIPEKLKQMQAMNLDVLFCTINSSTDTMIAVMNREVSSGADYIKSVPLVHPEKLTAHVTSTLRKSMHKTLTASRARTKLKSGGRDGLGGIAESDAEGDASRIFSIVSTEPDWAAVPTRSAALYMNKKVVDVGSLKSHGKLESMLVTAATAFTGLFSSWGGKGKSHESCSIKVASEPFATGNLRLARYGRILAGDAARVASGDYHPAAWKPCVFKDFKSKDPKSHELGRYLEEMEVNSVASALAAEFNKQHHPPVDRQMHYVLSSVALVTTPKGQRSYFVEPYLEGAFTRFSYNTGYWEEGVLDPWLLRFALWTYTVTDGFLMVADLQGVRNDKGYLLTDPVILCADLSRFGNTNLGTEMMARCKTSAEKHLADLTGAVAIS